MKLPTSVEKSLLYGIDLFFKIRPQPVPGNDRLRQCKLISHRGEHDAHHGIYENTLAAFDRAVERRVWGIEFDVRWTRDLHPVVIHDPDLNRVFDLEGKICEMTRAELKARCPAVPSLTAVIERYRRKLHLMVEIKAETYPDGQRQNDILTDCFSLLKAQRDYHLISLEPRMLDLINFIAPSAFIAISTLNLSLLSELVIRKDYGGIAGHYLLVDRAVLEKHRRRGQKVGTGYPRSKNCLFREINRGVDWVFSNNAGRLQEIVNKLIAEKEVPCA